jgi:hypothetical protein
MFKSTKRMMTVRRIRELYGKGERDFSNVFCKGADFERCDLSGSDFSGSDLAFSAFHSSNLSGCNLSNANFEWSGFDDTDLRSANLTKTNFQYSIFKKAKFAGASFVDTDMTWCLIFETDIENVIKKSVNFFGSAFDPSQVNDVGREQVRSELEKKRDTVSFDLFFEVQCIAKTTAEEIGRLQRISIDVKTGYGATNIVYGTGGQADGVSVINSYNSKRGYRTDEEIGYKA